MKERIRSTHVHDNDGKADQHLFPLLGEGGTIDWKRAMGLLRSRPDQYPLLLELKEVAGMAHPLDRVNEIFDQLEDIFVSDRITIAERAKHVGETVSIPGWLYNLRKSGKIVFPLLRDGTGIMQCVAVKSELPEERYSRRSRT